MGIIQWSTGDTSIRPSYVGERRSRQPDVVSGREGRGYSYADVLDEDYGWDDDSADGPRVWSGVRDGLPNPLGIVAVLLHPQHFTIRSQLECDLLGQ